MADLPLDIKKSNTFATFTKRIKYWNGDLCNCRLCRPQARRQLDWIGGTNIEIKLGIVSAYMLLICVNRQQVCPKIVFFLRIQGENVGLSPEKVVEVTLSKTSENAFL